MAGCLIFQALCLVLYTHCLIQSSHQLHDLCTTRTPMLDEQMYLRDKYLIGVKRNLQTHLAGNGQSQDSK